MATGVCSSGVASWSKSFSCPRRGWRRQCVAPVVKCRGDWQAVSRIPCCRLAGPERPFSPCSSRSACNCGFRRARLFGRVTCGGAAVFRVGWSWWKMGPVIGERTGRGQCVVFDGMRACAVTRCPARSSSGILWCCGWGCEDVDHPETTGKDGGGPCE